MPVGALSYLEVFDALVDPVVVLERLTHTEDLQFRIKLVNAAACATIKQSRANLIGQVFNTHAPLSVPEQLMHTLRNAWHSDQPTLLSNWQHSRDSQTKPRYFDIQFKRVNEILILTFRDVTVRVQQHQTIDDQQRILALFAESTSDIILGTVGRRITWASPSIAKVLGFSVDEVLDTSVIQLIHPDDQAAALEQARSATIGQTKQAKLRMLTRAGEPKWMEASLRLLQGTGEQVDSVLSLRDVDQEVAANAALAQAQEEYRLMAENAASIVSRTSVNGITEWVSPSVTHILGWQPAELIGRPIIDFVHPFDAVNVRKAQQQATAGETASMKTRMMHKSGGWHWFAIYLKALRDHTGEVTSRVAAWRDIQEDQFLRQELAASEAQLRIALDAAPVALGIFNTNGTITAANAAMCELAHLNPVDVVGKQIDDIQLANNDEIRELRQRAKAERVVVSHMIKVQLGDQTRWLQHSISPVVLDDDAPSSFVCQFIDVTQAYAQTEFLAEQAARDPLTSAFNRRALMSEMERLRADAEPDAFITVLYADLDGLKVVNDELGHEAGDSYLITAVQFLRHQFGEDVPIYRIGGDEFVILLSGNVNDAHLETLLSQVTIALRRDWLIPTWQVPVRISIGVTSCRTRELDDSAIDRADQAMYAAKRAGGRQLIVTVEDTTAPHTPPR